MIRAIGLAGLAVLCAGGAVHAQGVTVDVGYVARSGPPDLWAWRAGYTAPITGPLWWQLHGILLNDAGSSDTRRYGAGLELNAWRAGTGPFVVGSLDLGAVGGTSDDDVWGSWTAGAGYALGAVGGLSLAVDVRWRGFLNGEEGGPQFSAGLTYRWGGGKQSPTRAATKESPREPATAVPTDMASPAAVAPGARALLDNVVATARGAMGQPYRWGGQGEGGYDCSGLIQYSYAAHGITVPRTSRDQSEVGDAVGRELGQLQPGDILTFASSPGGGRTTHVGLYVGEGRFIHSASSRGVSESQLSGSDPNGAWWFSRWTGARRIVTGP